MRTSQTEMIYVVQLYTSYGWEDVTASSLRWEALAERNTYRKEQNMPVRLIQRRVWKDTQEAYRGPREVQAVGFVKQRKAPCHR